MRDNNAGLYGRNGVLPAKLALREGKKCSCIKFLLLLYLIFSQPSEIRWSAKQLEASCLDKLKRIRALAGMNISRLLFCFSKWIIVINT